MKHPVQQLHQEKTSARFGIEHAAGVPASFRTRGLPYLKKAGTNRMALPQYMRQSCRDWMRYAQSTLATRIPPLNPKPLPTENLYAHHLSHLQPDEFSFIVVGDTGMNSPGQYLVSTALSHQDIYPSDFCMILGDVMYPAGGEEGYKYGLLEAFRHYHKPLLAIPGNHDWYDNLNAFNRFFVQGDIPSHLSRQYDWTSPSLPNRYYHMDFGDAFRIICLDTGITGKMRPGCQTQLAWLDAVLESAGARKVVLMMHHPLYSLSNRNHEHQLRQLIEPRLEKANVVAVFFRS